MIIKKDNNILQKVHVRGNWDSDVNYIELSPTLIGLDDTDLGVSNSSLFDIIDCLDFSASTVGSIWFNFNFPIKWNISRDLYFDLYYSLDTSDDSKTVQLDIKTWILNIGDSISESLPDIDATEIITSSVDNTNKYSKFTINTNAYIPQSNFSTKHCMIIGKITRRSDLDTYTGLLKLVKIVSRQLDIFETITVVPTGPWELDGNGDLEMQDSGTNSLWEEDLNGDVQETGTLTDTTYFEGTDPAEITTTSP